MLRAHSRLSSSFLLKAFSFATVMLMLRRLKVLAQATAQNRRDMRFASKLPIRYNTTSAYVGWK